MLVVGTANGLFLLFGKIAEDVFSNESRAFEQTRWWLRSFVLATSVCLTLLIGISRVYLGVHWPTDVLAGWTAGAAWALLFWFLARRLTGR